MTKFPQFGCDMRFVRWWMRNHDGEIPKRFLGPMWRASGAGLIEIVSDEGCKVTRKGKKLFAKLTKGMEVA